MRAIRTSLMPSRATSFTAASRIRARALARAAALASTRRTLRHDRSGAAKLADAKVTASSGTVPESWKSARRADRFPRVVEGHATRIRVCGRLIVELQGRRLEDSLRGRQGRLLFSYLTLNRDRPVRRDELAEALWSGQGAPPASESLLAPPLSRLRKALGPGVLDGRSELQLILPADAWIDWEVAPERVREARRAAPLQAWEAAREAVEITERGLLPGLEAPWIDHKRAELSDLRVEALEAMALAGAQLGGAAWPEAEQA